MLERTGESTTGREPDARSGLNRRELLKFAGATLALLVSPVGRAASTSLVAVRIWPADEYTRVTLEGTSELKFSHMLVQNPERLVVDLEGVQLDNVLQSLPSKVIDSDPHIKVIRAGQNRPGVVRVVIELKDQVNPQVFTLAPVGSYGHRLVLDLHPTNPSDPLLALIRKDSPMDAAMGDTGNAPITQTSINPQPPAVEPPRAARRNEPQVNRLFTVVLDPGHGGEDPARSAPRAAWRRTSPCPSRAGSSARSSPIPTCGRC